MRDGSRSRDLIQTVRTAVPELDPDAGFPQYCATAPSLRHVFFSGDDRVAPTWRAERLTSAAEKPRQLGPGSGWIRTTDLARIDGDGFLFVLGRADGAIIRGGFKVLPERVRDALERHPAVRAAAVLGVPDERLGAVPVALVELRAGAVADGAAIASSVTGSLAGYERPAEIHVVPALPRTPSGKVDLRAAGRLLEMVRN